MVLISNWPWPKRVPFDPSWTNMHFKKLTCSTDPMVAFKGLSCPLISFLYIVTYVAFDAFPYFIWQWFILIIWISVHRTHSLRPLFFALWLSKLQTTWYVCLTCAWPDDINSPSCCGRWMYTHEWLREGHATRSRCILRTIATTWKMCVSSRTPNFADFFRSQGAFWRHSLVTFLCQKLFSQSVQKAQNTNFKTDNFTLLWGVYLKIQ